MSGAIVKVIVDAPFATALDYRNVSELDLEVGSRCLVPLGARKVIGIVAGFADRTDFPANRLKSVLARPDDVGPLSENWLRLTAFAARYYQSPWGRVAIASLPKFFRSTPTQRHAQSLKRLRDPSRLPHTELPKSLSPELNEEQQKAVNSIDWSGQFQPVLLFGITGSGKTEVYLHLIERVLGEDPSAQVLMMIPEINLTQQLVDRIQSRFPDETLVTWNSSLAEGQKAAGWLACHEQRARILVGTRLSVFASLPKLRLIIVDEEHDTSFKSGEGTRYSARDLAIKRAQIENIPILLGSATPSYETYKKAIDGAYKLIRLNRRAVSHASLPRLEIIDTRLDHPKKGLCAKTIDEVNAALQRGEQVIFFLNRRGYAPIVECASCGWQSGCPNCSAHTVYHKSTGLLTCHWCGWSAPLFQVCPQCGSFELKAAGRGTQRAEEEIMQTWPDASIVRLDLDTTRRRGSVEQALEKVHSGQANILIGTQIVAKGHDFRNVTLVVVLNSDAQLLSGDYRARERLFSVLMQVSGRAGRAQKAGKVLIQTRYPQDPLFAHLASQSYEGFAREELLARKASLMPPFSSQVLLLAQGRKMEKVIDFLTYARDLALSLSFDSGVTVYEPVAQAMARVAGLDRAQLLFEAHTRAQMHKFLNQLIPLLKEHKTAVEWFLDVDPISY